MPRYFLSLANGERYCDEQGDLFDNDAAALAHARTVARELGVGQKYTDDWGVIVTDDKGHEIGRVPIT